MDVAEGAAVGGVEDGSLTVVVGRGDCSLWPAIMEPFGTEGGSAESRPEEIGSGDTGELATNDAFGCRDASVDWQAGDDGATVIRARVMPAS
jgi:hypothetical protein